MWVVSIVLVIFVATECLSRSPTPASLYNANWRGPSPPWDHIDMISHVNILVSSYESKTGREMMKLSKDQALRAQEIFNADFILLSHGIQASPILNYANKRGLQTWGIPWEKMTCMPSSKTAETGIDMTEREEFMRKVTKFGIVEGYEGIRISADKRRFKIKDAVVWNVHNSADEYLGQAAYFKEIEYL